MLARLPHPGFSLEPLIAEAKRRARQRRVLLLLLALAVGGGGTGLVFGGLAVYRAVSATRAPYEPGYFGIPTRICCAISYPTLASVSAPSGGAAWIVGSVAWRWDGTAWRSVPLPKVYGSDLQSVAAVAANDAWAVGREGNEDAGVPSRGLIEHWDGIRWSVVRPVARSGSALSAVSAAGPRNVWAAGATYHSRGESRAKARPLLLHWNGTAWRTVAVPWSRRGLEVSQVSAVGSTGVWAVGTDFRPDAAIQPEHYWNGRRWRSVPPPFGPKDPMRGFSATAWNDAWAVGNYRAGSMSVRSLAAHWDGRAWRVVSVPEAPGYNFAGLGGVADVGPADAWAVGESVRIEPGLETGPHPVFFHWDGEAWHLTPGAVPAHLFFRPLSIAAGRDGSVWAIGNCGVDNLVFRRTHGRWVATTHPRDAHWNSNFPARSRQQKLSTCNASG
jgi:hypothetical protein